jgi:hypothetical protein
MSASPTSSEIQAVSDAYDAALAQGEAKLEAYRQAKEAGDSREAARLLAEGKAYNADQQRLSDELRRPASLESGLAKRTAACSDRETARRLGSVGAPAEIGGSP